MIGILGGSYDPIHFGHLNLAVSMMETHSLSEVWFCPAAQNPLKPCDTKASALHRLEMVRLAIEKESRFKAIDTELSRQGPSYMIDTLKALDLLKCPKPHEQEYALILGEDAARDFYRWKDADEIANHVHLLTGSRFRQPDAWPLQGSHLIVDALKEGWTSIPVMEISSTEVRERLRRHQFCGHLVPGKVLDYIEEHRLY